MEQYEGTISSVVRECPYCGYQYQVEAEDYSEDSRIEECEECGKRYYASDTFYISHHADPDCELNNEEHGWQYNDAHKIYICSVCGKIKL